MTERRKRPRAPKAADAPAPSTGSDAAPPPTLAARSTPARTTRVRRVGEQRVPPTDAERSSPTVALPPPPASPQDVQRLRLGDITDPHGLLGAHPASVDDLAGIVGACLAPRRDGGLTPAREWRIAPDGVRGARTVRRLPPG